MRRVEAGGVEQTAATRRHGGILIPFRGRTPRVAPTAFIAPTAVLIGNVEVGEEASVWFGTVLRGDHPENGISVGPRSSIQDNAVIHVGEWAPTHIGADVTFGHGAMCESCRIGDGTIVGMGSIVLQDAEVGRQCVLGAGTVVLEGVRIPDRSLVAGVPGEVKKTLGGNAADWVARGSAHYVELAKLYRAAPNAEHLPGQGADAAGAAEGRLEQGMRSGDVE